MNNDPISEACSTIEHWLPTHLLEELASWDMLPQVVTDSLRTLEEFTQLP
jgi:hypothetical protein